MEHRLNLRENSEKYPMGLGFLSQSDPNDFRRIPQTPPKDKKKKNTSRRLRHTFSLGCRRILNRNTLQSEDLDARNLSLGPTWNRGPINSSHGNWKLWTIKTEPIFFLLLLSSCSLISFLLAQRLPIWRSLTQYNTRIYTLTREGWTLRCCSKGKSPTSLHTLICFSLSSQSPILLRNISLAPHKGTAQFPVIRT